MHTHDGYLGSLVPHLSITQPVTPASTRLAYNNLFHSLPVCFSLYSNFSNQ